MRVAQGNVDGVVAELDGLVGALLEVKHRLRVRKPILSGKRPGTKSDTLLQHSNLKTTEKQGRIWGQRGCDANRYAL